MHMQAYRGLPCSMHRHAFSYILKETCKTVEMQLTTSAGAGIQLQAYRYRLETEIQAQLHVNTIMSYIY